MGEIREISLELIQQDTIQNSRVKIYETYTSAINTEGTVMDKRLGVTSRGEVCPTCGFLIDGCYGHEGYIDLGMKIYNPLFIKVIEKILLLVCIDDKCTKYGKLPASIIDLNRLNLSNIRSYRTGLDFVFAKMKDKSCIGTIRGTRCTRIFKEDSIKFNESDIVFIYKEDKNSKDDIDIDNIYNLFSSMEGTYTLMFTYLGFSNKFKPVNMILQYLIVTPTNTRMFITGKNTIQSHFLTRQYNKIIEIVNSPNKDIELRARSLYKTISELIMKKDDKRVYNTILYLLSKSLEDIINTRSAVNSVRVVLGPPDSSITRPGYAEINTSIARALAYPIKVTSTNIKGLTKMMNYDYIVSIRKLKEDKKMRTTRLHQRALISIEIGDMVKIMMRTGDSFNIIRFPVISKTSSTPMRVQVHEDYNNVGSILKIPPAVISSLYGDYDGDEGQGDNDTEAMIDDSSSILYNTRAPDSLYCTVSLMQNFLHALYNITKDNSKVHKTIVKLVYDKIRYLIDDDYITKINFRYKLNYKDIDHLIDDNEYLDGKWIFSMALPTGFFYVDNKININDGILEYGQVTPLYVSSSQRSLVISIDIYFSRSSKGSQSKTNPGIKFIQILSAILNEYQQHVVTLSFSLKSYFPIYSLNRAYLYYMRKTNGSYSNYSNKLIKFYKEGELSDQIDIGSFKRSNLYQSVLNFLWENGTRSSYVEGISPSDISVAAKIALLQLSEKYTTASLRGNNATVLLRELRDDILYGCSVYKSNGDLVTEAYGPSCYKRDKMRYVKDGKHYNSIPVILSAIENDVIRDMYQNASMSQFEGSSDYEITEYNSFHTLILRTSFNLISFNTYLKMKDKLVYFAKENEMVDKDLPNSSDKFTKISWSNRDDYINKTMEVGLLRSQGYHLTTLDSNDKEYYNLLITEYDILFNKFIDQADVIYIYINKKDDDLEKFLRYLYKKVIIDIYENVKDIIPDRSIDQYIIMFQI